MASSKDETQAVALLDKTLSKIENDMNSLAILMEHFEKHKYNGQKYSAKVEDMMGKFAKLMRQFSRTEYEYEGPYSSKQFAERYKTSVAKSWKHKPEKASNSEAPLTEEEILQGVRDRAQKMEELQARRKETALLEGNKERPMITGPDGKTRYDFAADAESSDEDDADLITRVMSGDPNPRRNDTNNLVAAHIARLKSETRPVARRLTSKESPTKEDTTTPYSKYSLSELDDINSMHKDFLNTADGDENDDHILAEFKARASTVQSRPKRTPATPSGKKNSCDNYTLSQLDDMHTMHKSILTEIDSDEEQPHRGKKK